MRAPIQTNALAGLTRRNQPTQVVFSPQSDAMLDQVNPTLAELLRRVEAEHPDMFEISEGMRDPERQAQMVAQGKSQTQNSRHLTGNAVDIHMLGADGNPNWDFEAYRPIADTAKRIAGEMGIPDFVWGGDWKTLRDGVHFQVGGPGQAPASASHGGGEYAAAPTPTQPVPPQAQQEEQQGPTNALASLLQDPRAFMIQRQRAQMAPIYSPQQNVLSRYG